MSKVISIKTRQEIAELPLTQEEGKRVLEYLMNFEPKTDGEREIMRNLMRIAENNSGIDFFEFMWERSVK